MSIEVGALVLGVETDYRNVLKQLDIMDRAAKGVEQRQLSRSNSIKLAILQRINALKDEEKAIKRLNQLREQGPGDDPESQRRYAENLANFEERAARATRKREAAELRLNNARIRNVQALEAEQVRAANNLERVDNARAKGADRDRKTSKEAWRKEQRARDHDNEQNATYRESEKKWRNRQNGENAAWWLKKKKFDDQQESSARRLAELDGGKIARLNKDHDAALRLDKDFDRLREERQAMSQMTAAKRARVVAKAEIAAYEEAASDKRRFAMTPEMRDQRDSWMSQYRQQGRLSRPAVPQRFAMTGEMKDQADYWNRYYRDQARQQRANAAAQRRAQMAQQRRAAGAGFGLGALGLSAGFAAAVGTREIVSMTNQYQLLQQRLATVTTSQEHANLVFEKLGGVAERSRSSLGDMTELYVKLRNSNEKLGLSQNQTLKVTEAFSNSLRASGASGQAASSAMLQFGQAMSKGKLDGDEFRTVAETNAVAMKIFAKELGVTQGQMLKMREEGKLTAQDFANALIKNADMLAELANRGPLTMEQGLIQFKNSVLKTIGQSDDLLTAANNIAQAFVRIGKALEDNGPAIEVIGKMAVKIMGVVAALAALKSMASKLGWVASLIGGPATATAAGVGALVLGLDAREDYKAGAGARADRAARVGAKNEAELINIQFDLAKRQIAANKAYNAAVAEQAAGVEKQKALPGFMQTGADSLQREKLAKLKAERDRLTNEIKLAGDRIAAMRGMDTPGAIAEGSGESGDGKGTGKKAKDDTDAYLSALIDLHEKEKLRAIDIVRGMDILAAEEELLKSKTASTEDYARALERVEKLQKAGFMTSLDTKQSVGDVERVFDLNGKPIKDNGKPLKMDTTDNIEKVSYSKVQEKFSHFDIFLSELWKGINDEIKIIGLDLGMGLSGAITTGVTKGLADGLTEAKGAVGGALGSMGKMLTDVGGKLVLKGLGSFFKKVGLSIGIFGKLMLKFQAMAAANPLAMGAVAIGVGLAMSALASKIGGAASGSSGFEGGSIGGLSVGRPTDKAQTYTFGQDRGRMVTSNGVPVAAADPVQMNFTVIGANDVRAQTEITKMVRAGMRRGS